MNLSFATLLAILLLAPMAQAQTPPCPASLTIRQVVTAPADFKAYADGNPPLAGDQIETFDLARPMFSEGPPEQEGWLAPDAKDAKQIIWNFKADADQNVWISCAYTGTTALLSKPLQAGVSSCSSGQTKGSSPTVTCR